MVPRSVEHHEACKGEIRHVLGRLHDFDPLDKEACPIWDTIQEAQAFRTMTDGMKYFLGAVGIVTLFLGGLGVMNVMLVAVRERTREIGVRKAMGAPANSILRQFFLEALIVALVSGGVGLLIAFGLCALVDLLADARFLRRTSANVADRSFGIRRSRDRSQSCPHSIRHAALRRSIRLRPCGTRRAASMTFQVLSEAWTALRRNRTRSALTMLGIVWGIATVTLLIAYGGSFREILVSGFDAFGKGAVISGHNRRVNNQEVSAPERKSFSNRQTST